MAPSCNSVELQTRAEVWGRLVPVCSFVTQCHQLGQCLRSMSAFRVSVQSPGLLLSQCCWPCSALTLLAHLCPQIQDLFILAVLYPLPCCGTISLTDPKHTSEFLLLSFSWMLLTEAFPTWENGVLSVLTRIWRGCGLITSPDPAWSSSAESAHIVLPLSSLAQTVGILKIAG